jgi:hypothetical protein
MVLVGDKAQVDAHFGLFGDCANLDARYMHDLRRMYHRLGNLISVHLKTVLVSVQVGGWFALNVP